MAGLGTASSNHEPLIKAICKAAEPEYDGQPIVDLRSGQAWKNALKKQPDPIRANNEVFKERRDLVVSMLNQPRASSARAARRVLVYPSCAGTIGRTTSEGAKINNDEDFVLTLLDEEGVAVVHGAAFAMSPFFRISYATAPSACRGSLQAHPALLRQPSLGRRACRAADTQCSGSSRSWVPVAVALATLAMRRWGPAVVGMLMGLPLMTGPISLFLAVDQGIEDDFATAALIGRFCWRLPRWGPTPSPSSGAPRARALDGIARHFDRGIRCGRLVPAGVADQPARGRRPGRCIIAAGSACNAAREDLAAWPCRRRGGTCRSAWA